MLASGDGNNGQRRRTIDGILSVIRRSEEENSNDLHPPEAEDDPPSYVDVFQRSRPPSYGQENQDQEEPPASKPSIDAPPAYSDS